MSEQTAGSLGTPKDAGPGEEGEVKRWLLELDLADKAEKKWREKAKKCLERYDDEKDRSEKQFNILWSNTEVLRPQLYGSSPKADVRQRFKQKDPVGSKAAEVVERALDTTVESYDFDGEMEDVILDYVLPGRAVARVKFEPVITQTTDPTGAPTEALSYAKVYCERWPWEQFRRGPAKSWAKVPWVAYEHHLTKEELEEKIPGVGDKVTYDILMDGVEKDVADKEPTVFKRVRVWEIWDKEKREILFLAPSLKERFLKREPDPLKLEGFFDCPRPLYAIRSGNSLVPQVEYDKYADQAKELDKVTGRINALIGALKVRGLYNSTISEFKDLFSSGDNQMIPTSTSQQAMEAGGLDKAVWMMPIERIVQVLRELYVQRDQIKQTIYELTGISDILRGSSDPNETLGAQQLKAQTGNMRLQRRQREVQRFVRDILRKKAEIIAENFTPELLAVMTGVKLPTAEDKQAVAQYQQIAQQAAAQQMQPPPPPIPPEAMQEIMTNPTWEEVMGVLQSDILRAFRIDIETDSTIAADQASEREQVTELITGIGGFMQQMAPAVQSGVISMPAAKSILVSALRRFKLGRSVEDVLEADEQQPQQQGPSPEQLAQQQEAQVKQAELQQKHELSIQEMQLSHQNEKVRMAEEGNAAREKLAADHALKQSELAAKQQMTERELLQKRELAEMEIASKERIAMAGIVLDHIVQSSQAQQSAIQAADEAAEGSELKDAHGEMFGQAMSGIQGAMKQIAEAMERQNVIAAAPRKAVRVNGQVSHAVIELPE